MSFLPNELASLQLKTIKLQNTSITSLPEWFSSFDLKELDISGLKITNVGNILEYLFNYPNLEDLRAKECNINIVPIDFFTKLTKIEFADLSFNHISEFPEIDDDFALETDPQIVNGEKIYFYEND